jgi:hypothetical protein
MIFRKGLPSKGHTSFAFCAPRFSELRESSPRFLLQIPSHHECLAF